MKTTLKLPPWLWASVVGIVLVTVSIALIYRLKPNYSVAPPSEGANLSNESKPVDSTLRTTSAEPLVAVETNSTPTLTYSIGTVEEACGIHEYPPYWDYLEDFEDSDHEELLMRAITSAECRDALDAHVGTMNPYLWGHPMVYVRQFAFVKIENPLTFDRVFTDPTGDFARVQFALSRSECLLENGTTTNFELKESCNADALLNYALLNRYCFHGEDSNRTYYNSDPTPEESKLMWKQDLEELWVRTKCKEFDSDLELTEARYPDLTKLLSSLADSDSLGLAMLNVERRRIAERPYPEILPSRFLIATLIDMAARLGDDAAALTFQWYGENGINLGRFKELELSPLWKTLRWKREPSQERLLKTFHFLPTVTNAEIKFDWEWLVRHLCEPPFPYDEQDPQTRYSFSDREYDSSEPKSCRAMINELYTFGGLSDSMLDLIERFERTAMELDLYH